MTDPDRTASAPQRGALGDGHAFALTSFVGRDAEIAAVARALERGPMVTITGPGGAGKSRLADRVVVRHTARWPGGIVLVSLASVQDADRVPGEILDVLGTVAPGTGDPLAAAATRLPEEPLLLVLDNCEHLGEAPGRAARALLTAAPQLQVLATSRQAPLRVPGERIVDIAGLSLHSATSDELDADAVCLFADRARAADASFELDARTRPAVMRICRQLEGLPLAIELAAARTRMFDVAELADDLEAAIAVAGRQQQAQPDRHRSLHASLHWGYDLLEADERAVLLGASVFAGSFAAADLAYVSPVADELAVLDIVSRLVEKSMLVSDRQGDTARYRLLAPVREFAVSRLCETGELQRAYDAHLACMRDLALGSDELRLTLRGRATLQAAEPDLRAALAHAERTAPGDGLALVAGMNRWWLQRGRDHEGLDVSRRLLAATGAEAPLALRCRARCLEGTLCIFTGDYAGAGEAMSKALEAAAKANDAVATGHAHGLATLMFAAVDPERAIEHGRSAIATLDDAGHHPSELAWALAFTAIAHVALEQAGPARATATRALKIGKETKDLPVLACAEGVLGIALIFSGQVYEGNERLRRAERLGRGSMPVLEDLTLSYRLIGAAYAGGGDALRVQAVSRLDGDEVTRLGRPTIECGIAAVDLARGRLEEAFARATPLLSCPLVHYADLAHTVVVHVHLAHGRHDDVRALLASPRTPRQSVLVDYATGRMALAEGDARKARRHFQAAFDEYLRIGRRSRAIACLEAIAVAAVPAGEPVLAARVLASCHAERARIGARPLSYESDDLARTAEAVRAQLGDDGFAEAWASGAQLEVEAVASGDDGSLRLRSDSWDSLTDAEAHVTRLAAQGLTNPQIGERLFISRSTVKAHLARAFAKLGVCGRTELAAIVAALGDHERRDRR